MSPDGRVVVTGAGDETLRFWNVFGRKPGAREEGDAGGGSKLGDWGVIRWVTISSFNPHEVEWNMGDGVWSREFAPGEALEAFVWSGFAFDIREHEHQERFLKAIRTSKLTCYLHGRKACIWKLLGWISGDECFSMSWGWKTSPLVLCRLRWNSFCLLDRKK